MMNLLTPKIETELQFQYSDKTYLGLLDAKCKLYHPITKKTWYLICQNPEKPDEIWALVKDNFDISIRPISLKDLQEDILNGKSPIRSKAFKPVNVALLFEALMKQIAWIEFDLVHYCN